MGPAALDHLCTAATAAGRAAQHALAPASTPRVCIALQHKLLLLTPKGASPQARGPTPQPCSSPSSPTPLPLLAQPVPKHHLRLLRLPIP